MKLQPHYLTLLGIFVAAPVCADISRLGWLSGCWQYDDAENGSGEYWMSPAGGTMLAVSRIVGDGETRGFEWLRIETDDDHHLTLFAQPGGAPATAFQLVRIDTNSVVFENTAHDFPNRIEYRRNDDRLLGRIEGTVDGIERVIDFPMHRVDCEGSDE